MTLLSVDFVKEAAEGQWGDILKNVAGLPMVLLDGKGHPCPKCSEGVDRFSVLKDFNETGAVLCRFCFYKQNGDGIAAVQWATGKSFPESLRAVADYLGVPDATEKVSRKKPSRNGRPRIVAKYNYRDEAGNVVFQAVRREPKDFRQRKPKPRGGWEWSVKGVRVLPYRLPELLAEPTRPVLIVAGEKDCDNLARIGLLATCSAGGACKWPEKHATFLQGRRVIILPDNDEKGRKHARQVAESLQAIAKWVKMIELPDLPEKGDTSDWIAAGGTKAVLKQLIAATPEWKPETAKAWPDLQTFDQLDLPDFPSHALPDELRHWVEAESHATQTPADMAGLLALAVCSACIARRVVIEPRPGWREPVNLSVAVLMEPANRKSGVFANALKPLNEYEAELIETARPEIARLQSDRRQAETRLKALEKKAANSDDPEVRHEAGNLAAEIEGTPEPMLPRLVADDATSEKLGMMLADQRGRITSMSPGAPVAAYSVIGLFAAGIASSLTLAGITVQLFGERLWNRQSRLAKLPWPHIRAGLVIAVGLIYLGRATVQ